MKSCRSRSRVVAIERVMPSRHVRLGLTPPHPPFGHLLPASGEKGNHQTRCPSPRLWGEGGAQRRVRGRASSPSASAHCAVQSLPMTLMSSLSRTPAKLVQRAEGFANQRSRPGRLGLTRRIRSLVSFCFLCALLLATTAHAEDAVVIGGSVDRSREGNGGGASVDWIRSRANGNVTAGATFLALQGARWAYASVGGMHRLDARTMITAGANLGGGEDDSGDFRYIVLRAGVTRELSAKRLYGEGEWLQTDVARRQNGIARIGATFLPAPPFTLRGSLFQSIAGDDDTTLVTVRGDYDFGRITAIAGFSAGRATPALLQQAGGEPTRVREAFAGIIVNDLTFVVLSGDERQRVSLSWRVPVAGGTR